MASTRGDIEKTRIARRAILEHLRTHPNLSTEEIARSGLYAPVRAKHPERSAKNWARVHILALLDEGLVERIDQKAPHRFRVTRRQEPI